MCEAEFLPKSKRARQSNRFLFGYRCTILQILNANRKNVSHEYSNANLSSFDSIFENWTIIYLVPQTKLLLPHSVIQILFNFMIVFILSKITKLRNLYTIN